MTKKEQAATEAMEGRQLVIIALAEHDGYLTPAELGGIIGYSGYQTGQFLRVLVEQGKVKRAGTGAGKYLYTKMDNRGRTTVPEPKKEVIQAERWLISWMIAGKGFGHVVTTKEEAKTKANALSKDLPGVVLFYGKASKRVCNIITETDMP